MIQFCPLPDESAYVREDGETVSPVRPRDLSNARLNLCRKATGLSRARVQLHIGDRAGLAPRSGSFSLQSVGVRGEGEAFFDTEPRVPKIPA